MTAILLRKLNTAVTLSMQQWCWLLPLYLLSGLYRLWVLWLPFKTITQRFITNHQNEPAEASNLQLEQAREFGTLIKLISRYTPWQCNCLVQAMLTNTVLSLYSIPHQSFIGVKKTDDSSEAIEAHAWVKCGDLHITGGDTNTQYRAFT